ncbi:MAG: tetratricopeptide repeat protein [Pyrinomonadaceae bacterium]|nr:tetratricopeptide repeat protein [Pyrinomonadaceae bacterium]
MRKWIIASVLAALVVTIGIAGLWSAETIERGGDGAANVISSGGTPVGGMWSSKQSENRFAKVFKAPFRAVRAVGNKLLGRNKDKEIVLLERINEKDARKFERSDVARVDKVSTSAPPPSEGIAQEHLVQGRGLLDREKINEAIAELSVAASLDPRLGEAHNLLGIAYDRKGLRQRARESYERALRATPNNVQILNNLGYSLYLDGNYRAAVKRLKHAVKLAPNDQRTLNNLALAQSRLGKYDDAFKTFERAGGELNARLNTAAMLERAGRDTEAIKHYEDARRLEPNSATALRRLADLYARVGRHDEAEAAGRAVLVMPRGEVVAGKGAPKQEPQ